NNPPVSRKFTTGSTKNHTADIRRKGKAGNSQNNIDDKGYWDSGWSRHMTGNISYLSDFEPFDGGYVSLGQGGCRITGKGTIKTGKLEFEDVYFVKDLKYNLFGVSQICDNKNSVLFTDAECIVLGRNFKLLDDANILLRTPRQHNMYSIDLNNIVPHNDLTCFVAKASADECNLWHRALGHLNVKTMNKLVRHNLVRGVPTKSFDNDHTCTAYLKGKQHKASCKSKLVNSVTKPLHTLHMDLFGPTSVSSISHKWYCLVVTDDFSRFTWTFFLSSKDETSGILKKFITKIENLKVLKVKIIRCDNGGEFRNKEIIDFCLQKGNKREFSNARTPQQNGVTERRNRTLIEAAKTMLADAKLPVTFWAEAVNTACYVQNRVLRSDKVKEEVGYDAVPPPAIDLYLSPKKDLSWTGLPEFVDDTVTDYSRPSPTVASTSAEGQNKDSSTSEDDASPNTPKPFVKFVKPKESQSENHMVLL
nr:putative ribonuclease H-like domain-containing protein [Tanacetum cinerariifolium]